jgi:glucosyl-3-phosphoglycerate synthase
MEYVQERITTLHDFGDAAPDAPTDRTAVVVPMTDRDHASLAAERVLGTLERVDPGRVVIPLRADAHAVGDIAAWVGGFDLRTDLLWCTAPRVEELLEEHGLEGTAGKGRDVWLGLGLAADAEYVVVHDADATNYAETHVPRLLAPLAYGYEFSKGYYARVENGHLYGRLCRLLYEPLVSALAADHDHPLFEYLGAFRYALAGEFAVTAAVARELRVQRGWGLEVGTLGDAYAAVGLEGTAQVDLGIHEHDHRSVGGPEGLGDMSREVAAALFRVLEDAGLDPDYGSLPDRYRSCARRLIDQYAADATFNDLAYDPIGERKQVDTYAGAIEPPGADRRLPRWRDTSLDPDEVGAVSAAVLEEATER